MRSAIFGIALILLIAAGAWELSNRTARADSQIVKTVQSRLDSIPESIGEWKSEDQTYDERQMERTGSFAAFHRLYRKAKSNETISVLILAGPAQEIGSHDPNRCYVGAGYRPVGTAVKKILPDPTPLGTCSYWTARFDTDTFPSASLQVYWAWSLNGQWSASENARYEFVREPVLYKLYLSRRLSASNDETLLSTEEFLNEFVPEVQKCLSPN